MFDPAKSDNGNSFVPFENAMDILQGRSGRAQSSEYAPYMVEYNRQHHSQTKKSNNK